jgi:hypothetical protein
MRVENSVSNGVWLGSERLTVGGLAGIYRFVLFLARNLHYHAAD